MLQWHVRLVIFTKIILYCIISNSNWKSCCELSLETTVASGRIRLEIKLVSFSATLKNMSHSNIRQFKTIFLPGTGMFNCFSLLSLHWFQYLNKWILAIGIAISKSRVCISQALLWIYFAHFKAVVWIRMPARIRILASLRSRIQTS